MLSHNKQAFTLVELIVVITVLAILATIWYLSIVWYSQDARNSARISDMRVIEKALSLIGTSWELFPVPDDARSVTYSGSTVWTQWTFASGALAQLRRVSDVPKDPIFWVPYSYSVLPNRTIYQLWAVTEWWVFAKAPIGISASYAFSGENLLGYTRGNYITQDVYVSNGGDCYLLSSPSIILSEIPSSGSLLADNVYNYAYQNSLSLPLSYSGSLTDSWGESSFQVSELYNRCSIGSITELELYIAKLSTSYQQLADTGKYDPLIFNSNTNNFKLWIANSLVERWFIVEDAVIKELKSPLPQRVFIDTFTDTNGTNIESHSSLSSSWSWLMHAGWTTGSYTIQSWELAKNNNSISLVYPVPLPAINSDNYGMSFQVKNFAGGTISWYLRYTDTNNYYSFDISGSWYQIMRREWWVLSVFQNISETIYPDDTISFSARWDSLVFSIGGIEKENILAGWISWISTTPIFMQNAGASIDDFTLTYK